MTTKMEITPTKKEIAKTSTPVFPPCDSGYFSSNAKSYCKYPIFALTPINEHSLQKKFSGLYSSTCKSISGHSYSAKDSEDGGMEWSSSSIVRQLDYDESGFGNESLEHTEEARPEALPLFAWASPDRKSTNKRGKGMISSLFQDRSLKPRVDFLSWLKKRNCERIISDLLCYFPPEDLCRMECVCKQWKEIILKDVKANGRRREYLKNIRTQRENKHRNRPSPFEIKKRYERLSSSKLILHEITNIVPVTEAVPKRSYNTRFDSFVREGRNIQSGTLMKCPKCFFAAKSQNQDEYICTECKYVFCKKCFLPYGNAHDCSMLSVPMLIVGSERCKKNLRRL